MSLARAVVPRASPHAHPRALAPRKGLGQLSELPFRSSSRPRPSRGCSPVPPSVRPHTSLTRVGPSAVSGAMHGTRAVMAAIQPTTSALARPASSIVRRGGHLPPAPPVIALTLTVSTGSLIHVF